MPLGKRAWESGSKERTVRGYLERPRGYLKKPGEEHKGLELEVGFPLM